MDKLKLEYEETEEGYILKIDGSKANNKSLKDKRLETIEHQLKIIGTIYFKLTEEKYKLQEIIENDG